MCFCTTSTPSHLYAPAGARGRRQAAGRAARRRRGASGSGRARTLANEDGPVVRNGRDSLWHAGTVVGDDHVALLEPAGVAQPDPVLVRSIGYSRYSRLVLGLRDLCSRAHGQLAAIGVPVLQHCLGHCVSGKVLTAFPSILYIVSCFRTVAFFPCRARHLKSLFSAQAPCGKSGSSPVWYAKTQTLVSPPLALQLMQNGGGTHRHFVHNENRGSSVELWLPLLGPKLLDKRGA